MFKKIKSKFKTKKETIKDWWTDCADAYMTNGELTILSFLAGSGSAAWWYIIIIGTYCLITKQKLGFVKR